MTLNQKGQSLIELLLAIGLAAILLPSILTGLTGSREGRPQQKKRLQAAALVYETEEALRSVREKGWTTFAVNGTYHPQISGSAWILVEGEETVNGLTRAVEISDVYRDSNNNIVESGGILDPSTKKVVVTVSWNEPYLTSVSSTVYLTRYLENTAFLESSADEFNQGTTDGTVVVDNQGGEIILAAGGQGLWCGPNLSQTVLDLPKQGEAIAITAIEGRAFVGTGVNASGVSFANVSITNENPPNTSIDGTVDGYKTNGVFGDSNFAYIATDTNQKEIIIVDLNQKGAADKYQEVGYFDSPGPQDGENIFVSGSVGYMTAGNKLYTFDLSSKTGQRAQLGEIALAGVGKKVIVSGGFAYLAINASPQLQIINVSNPASPSIVGQTTVDGAGGRDLFVNETATRAYLVTASSSTQAEYFIIDTSSPSGERPTLSSFDTNGMDPKGVTVVPGNVSLVIGRGGEEYQALNISDELNPLKCGGVEVDTGIFGIASVLEADDDAFSYIITGDANAEFKIIEGGPGGGFSIDGTFESQTFDPGYQTAFNRLSFTKGQPLQTEIKLQVTVADTVSGSCQEANFEFVGPDGTPASYFTEDQAIPLNDDGLGFENPGRCFRYKVYFQTDDFSQTPIFYDITVNYSP